jgi:hypothetical protein
MFSNAGIFHERYNHIGSAEVILLGIKITLTMIMATSFSGGRSRSTRIEPPTMGKQLVTLSLAAASRVHLFCNSQSRARTHVILVIGLYELLGNPTT